VNGNAQVDGDQLVLTESLGDQVGTAFLRTRIPSSEFRARFDVEISQSLNTGADGLTFALLASGDPGSLGGRGGGMGLSGLDGFAVEFDTWAGGTDPSANHLGLVHGQDVQEHFASADVPVTLDEGGIFHVSIFAEAGTFSVSLASTDRNLPESTILVGTFPEFPGGDVYFGFTAATGGASSRHAVDNFILQLPAEARETEFVRGDVNGTLLVDLSDAIALLGNLFFLPGAPSPACRDILDGNDDGAIDLTDAVFLLRFLFLGGSEIPPPYPDPGRDPTPDGLACE